MGSQSRLARGGVRPFSCSGESDVEKAPLGLHFALILGAQRPSAVVGVKNDDSVEFFSFGAMGGHEVQWTLEISESVAILASILKGFHFVEIFFYEFDSVDQLIGVEILAISDLGELDEWRVSVPDVIFGAFSVEIQSGETA